MGMKFTLQLDNYMVFFNQKRARNTRSKVLLEEGYSRAEN